MLDLVVVLILLAFAGASLGFVRVCGWLKEGDA